MEIKEKKVIASEFIEVMTTPDNGNSFALCFYYKLKLYDWFFIENPTEIKEIVFTNIIYLN